MWECGQVMIVSDEQVMIVSDEQLNYRSFLCVSIGEIVSCASPFDLMTMMARYLSGFVISWRKSDSCLTFDLQFSIIRWIF